MPDKIPPHSREAEQSTLGAAMLSEEALGDIMEEVNTEDFYDPGHREIFAAIKELFRRSEPVDLLTVSEELNKRGSLEIAGGRDYVLSLPSLSPSISNAAGYAKVVAKKSMARKILQAASDIQAKGYDESLDGEDILDFAEQSIYEVAKERESGSSSHIKDILIENTRMIDRASKAGGKLGLTTGFASLDKMTTGLQRGDLIVLAARPSMGKSALALTMALNAAKKDNARIIIFTLEMTKEQMGQRLLSMESHIELGKLREGKVNTMDWKDINLAIDKMSKTEILIDNSANTAFQIKNKCRREKAKKGLDLIIIDHLQLMEADGRSDSRQQEISKISRQLKLMAMDLNCPVMLISQLSRAPEMRNDKRPMLSDLRESGAIEQDADMVMLLYRDDYYHPEDSEKPNICEVHLAKNRNGETGKVDLTWIARYTKFSDRSGEADEVYNS